MSTTTTTRRGRFRRAAVAVAASAVATAALIPMTTGVAAAAVKGTTTSITCSNFTAGSTATCTVKVVDDTDSDDPSGSVSLNLSNLAKSAVVGTNSCTLVADTGRGKDESSCSLKVTAWAAGTLNLGATYTSDDTANWASETSSASLKALTVTLPSNMVITTRLSGYATLGLTPSIDVYGANCAVSSGTAQGYVLAAYNADPTASGTTPWVIGPFSVASDKSWSWATSIGADHPTGTFRARYVCANGAVTSKSDSNIQFTTASYSTTISGNGGSPFTSLLRASAGSSATVAQGDVQTGEDTALSVAVTIDPDELNDVDNIGVVKANVDELKRRTDALVPASSTVSRIGYALTADGLDRTTTEKWTSAVRAGTATASDVAAAALSTPAARGLAATSDADFVAALYRNALGRDAEPFELDTATAVLRSGTSRAQLTAAVAGSAESTALWTNRSYVVAAFQTTTATMPSAEQLSRFTTELGGGGFKVNTVENIALTAASAADWNAAVPLGRTPAEATFAAPAAPPAAAPPAAVPPAAVPVPVAVRPPAAAPAPVTKSATPKRSTAKRRATVRRTRKAVVRKAVVRKAPARKAPARKAPARKVVVKRTATVRPPAARTAPTRKVVAKRTATVRKLRR